MGGLFGLRLPSAAMTETVEQQPGGDFGFRPWAIVVAAGSGRRFGRPKQLELVAGRRVIDWSVAALRAVAEGIIVVGPPFLGAADDLGVECRVAGGAERSDSVRNGLAALPDEATHVLIHDAARPLVPPAVVRRVVEALASGADAVVPVVPVVDSLRRVDGPAVDRTGFVAVQTPQGFRAEVVRQAHESGLQASDDATVVEQLGVPVTQVEGHDDNIKITYPRDLAVAEVLARSMPAAEEARA